MAIPGSIGKDNLDISFRLNSKTNVFDGSSNALTNAKANIVASASSLGLVFVGSSNAEIFVICTKDLELPTALNQNAPVRKIPMPSPVIQLATNCDGSILAVDVKINGIPHIQLYSVPSFLNPNILKLREFRVSADNASSTQLCWNPVISSILAVCTESGGLNLYSFKDQGVEFHNIDPSLRAKCCCWSPKGKQIVAGFMSGKLMQFNMELKPARTIECPPAIFQGGNFDVIAVQWLSTYQFAIAFLSHQEESRPILHILNAPKAGPPQYIVYNDVCYSTSEVRPSKMYLQYVQQWGMLLVASANCVDVSFLRISKPGDIPEWIQEFPNDQYPAEMPLTPEKDESFPVGFEFETACTNKLPQEDGSQYPIMPMIHLVSTYGVMCSFYVLNTTSSYVDICSPPRPIDPRVQSLFTVNVSANVPKQEENAFKTPIKIEAPATINTSTPALLPKANLFGSVPTVSPFSMTASQSQSTAFSGFSMAPSLQPQQVKPQPVQATFQMPASKPLIAPTQPTVQPVQAVPQNQPLITILPTYNPQMTQQKVEVKEIVVSEKLTDAEDEQIYLKMIQDEMKAFELELNFIMERSKSLKVNIGTKDESAEMRRKLEELDELKKEATETVESLRSDIQTNRLGLTEMFSMVYEAKSKLDQSNNERSIIKTQNQMQDRSIKRTLEKLKKMISQCEMQIHIVVQLLNSQWANYQDSLGKNKKNRMHVPSLENVYQTLTKNQQIVYNLSVKLNLLKTKLGICDDVKKQRNANISATIESFSDSIISMSLIDQVQNERSKMTSKKLKSLVNYLSDRPVVTIKPQRPKLPGLNSEIIIEKKIQAIKNLKKPEAKKVVPQPKEIVPQSKPITVVPTVQNVPKPQPSESVFDFTSMQQQSVQKTPIFTPVTNVASQPQLSFGKKTEEPTKNTGFSFGSALQTVPQSNFGLSLSTSTKSGLNLSTSSNPMNLSNPSMPPPSFSTSGFATNLNIDKKKEEPAIVPKIPQPIAKPAETKPISTISNANVTVSANFSVPLPAKTSPSSIKEALKVEEKKPDEPKPLTTNESTSFTFSLPGKKDSTALNKPASVISFGNSPSTASDSVKSAFSFGSAPNAFSFGSASKANEVKSTTSSTSIFPGGASFGFGDAAKVSSSGNTSIFAAALGTPQIPKTVEDLKVSSTSSVVTTTASSTGGSIFGISTSAAPPSDSKSSFSFANFGSSITSASSDPISSVTTKSVSIFAEKNEAIKTQEVSSSTNADLSPITPPPTSSVQSSTADSVLQGLNICSPTTTASVEAPSAPTNIFASPIPSTKAETSSIFGSSSFGANFGSPSVVTTKSSIFSTPPSTATTTASSSTPVTSSTQSESIFGQSVKTSQATSSFGGLDLSSKSASSTDFGQSLVKPDQSVFGQSSVTVTSTPATTGTFGNIFAAAAANIDSKSSNAFGSAQPSSPSNIFGSVTTQASTTPSNIFGSQQQSPGIFGQTQSNQPSSQGSIFGQTAATTSSNSVFGQVASTSSTGSIFGQTATTSSGSVFGQVTTTASTGSIFSQESFSSPNTTGSIFGGAAQTQSPFGGTSSGSIFNSGSQPSQQSTSIFGGSSAFGQSPPAQPGSNIFGSSGATNTQSTSPFGGGNIFTQNQSQSTFGGNPSFSNSFGQSSFGTSSSIFSQQQNQPVFGGGATFGSPKSNIFGAAVPPAPQSPQQGNNIFEQLGQQQSGNLFGSLAQATQPPQQGVGFSGSAFSSWR